MDQNSLGHCVIPWVMKEIRGEAEGNLGGGGVCQETSKLIISVPL